MSKRSFSSSKDDDEQDWSDSGVGFRRKHMKHEGTGYDKRKQEPMSAEKRLQVQRMKSSEEKYRLISPSQLNLMQIRKNPKNNSDEEMLETRPRRHRKQIKQKDEDEVSNESFKSPKKSKQMSVDYSDTEKTPEKQNKSDLKFGNEEYYSRFDSSNKKQHRSHRIKKHKKYSSYDRDSRDSGERRYDRHEKRSRHRSRGGKLETLNITKCLRKIQRRYLNDVVVKELITSMVHHLHPMHLVIDAFHGLGTYQPNFNGLTIPTQEAFETNPQLLTRLRGAKIDGFEGSKMLELKINRKRLAKGEEKIDLQKECEEDLRIRRNDQYALFLEILRIYAPIIISQPAYQSQIAQSAYSATMQASQNPRAHGHPQLQQSHSTLLQKTQSLDGGTGLVDNNSTLSLYRSTSQDHKMVSVQPKQLNILSQCQVDEQARLKNIRQVKFVVPSKLINSQKISLQKEIPFLCPPSEQMKKNSSQFELQKFKQKRKLFWAQLRGKIQGKIDCYYEEMQQMKREKKEKLKNQNNLQTAQGQGSSAEQDIKKKSLSNVKSVNQTNKDALPKTIQTGVITPAGQGPGYIDSDQDEFTKIDRPVLTEAQRHQLEQNILRAMEQASITAKNLETPKDLDWATLEMILFLTQKSVSDLKEIRHRNTNYQSPQSNYISQVQANAIRQVTELPSNSYGLKDILNDMMMSAEEKVKYHQQFQTKLHEAFERMQREHREKERDQEREHRRKHNDHDQEYRYSNNQMDQHNQWPSPPRNERHSSGRNEECQVRPTLYTMMSSSFVNNQPAAAQMIQIGKDMENDMKRGVKYMKPPRDDEA